MKSDQFEKMVEDEKVEGWSVKEDGDERVVMVKRKWGTLGAHGIIFILAGWWTLGAANVIYAAYKYFADADQKVVRDPNPSKSTGTQVTESQPTGAQVTD